MAGVEREITLASFVTAMSEARANPDLSRLTLSTLAFELQDITRVIEFGNNAPNHEVNRDVKVLREYRNRIRDEFDRRELMVSGVAA